MRTRGTSAHHQTWQTPHPKNLHPTVQAGNHCHTRPNPHNPRHGHQPIDKFNSDQKRRRAIAHRLLHRVCHEGYGWRLLLTASRAPLLMCTMTLDSSMGVHSHHLLPRWLSAEGAFTLVHLSSSRASLPLLLLLARMRLMRGVTVHTTAPRGCADADAVALYCAGRSAGLQCSANSTAQHCCCGRCTIRCAAGRRSNPAAAMLRLLHYCKGGPRCTCCHAARGGRTGLETARSRPALLLSTSICCCCCPATLPRCPLAMGLLLEGAS